MWKTIRITPESGAALSVVVSVLVSSGLYGCAAGARGSSSPPETASTSYIANPEQGESAFQMHCATCHGERGRGSKSGPPLVHRVYRVSHHSDLSFYKAVQRGVHAHHWSFGDMPAVAGVDLNTTADIIAYVRREQINAGFGPAD